MRGVDGNLTFVDGNVEVAEKGGTFQENGVHRLVPPARIVAGIERMGGEIRRTPVEHVLIDGAIDDIHERVQRLVENAVSIFEHGERVFVRSSGMLSRLLRGPGKRKRIVVARSSSVDGADALSGILVTMVVERRAAIGDN